MPIPLEDRPFHTLTEEDFVELVRQGKLCPYTECQALGRVSCEDCRGLVEQPDPASDRGERL